MAASTLTVGPRTATGIRSLSRSLARPALAPRRCSNVARSAYKKTVAFKEGETSRTTKTDIDVSEYTESFNAKAQEYKQILQDKWEETDEKPAVVAIGVAAFVALWATAGVIDRVDKLPIIGGLLEVVGLFVTSWFAYRYLAFKSDREELKSNIDSFVKKIGA